MPHLHYSGEEIARRGKALYEQRIRALVETPDNIGKIVSIDLETGDYQVGEDLIATGDYLSARNPGAALYSKQPPGRASRRN